MPTAGSYDFNDTALLPGGKPSAVSSIGFLPSSSGSSVSDDSSGGTGFDWKKIAGAGAGLLGSLFAPKSRSIDPEINAIEGGSKDLAASGKATSAQGQSALDPVLKYFKALASGDPSEALAATAPQRGRVIDQYDAARRSAANFTPRGGGQASAQQESRSREASDLANVTSTARTDATKELAALGSNLTQQGTSAQEASINAMVSTLQPLLAKQGQDSQSIGKTFAGIGELIGSFFL